MKESSELKGFDENHRRRTGSGLPFTFTKYTGQEEQETRENADRFAVFATGDVAGYIACIIKIDEYYKSIELEPKVRKQVIQLRNSGWKGRYTTTHPYAEDRIIALQCLEDHVHNEDFNISKSPEVYHQMLKLLNYDEFMSEFGEFYE